MIPKEELKALIRMMGEKARLQNRYRRNLESLLTEDNKKDPYWIGETRCADKQYWNTFFLLKDTTSCFRRSYQKGK